MPSLLSEVRLRFPALNLQLREAKTADLLALLRRGECDAVLVALPQEEEGLIAHPLFFEPFLVACPVGHPLQGFASSLEMLRHMIAAGEGFSLLRDEAVGRTIGVVWRASDPRRAEFEILRTFLCQASPAGTDAAA